MPWKDSISPENFQKATVPRKMVRVYAKGRYMGSWAQLTDTLYLKILEAFPTPTSKINGLNQLNLSRQKAQHVCM